MGRVLFDHVTKRFGDVAAVDDLTLEAEDREFLVLLGPSGCGKSTALRIVAGLEEATSGEVFIGDRRVNALDPKDRDVAMVFQTYALYPHMTVKQNIEFPLRRRNVPAGERNALVADVAQSLGLSPLMDRKPAKLSGGQRQRVALARAIVRRPEVFLMDEPLSNLDAKLRVQTRAELIELHRRLQTTVLYVTHDQVEAMTMGSRIAILNDGRLQQLGRPQEVYDRPANVFVAEFIGSPPMNVMPGAVGDGILRLPGAAVPAPVGVPSGDVAVAVRPEHLEPDADGELPAKVRVVESLGHERHVICELEDGTPLILRQAAADPAPADGESIRLRLDPDRLHLFDAATGQRVHQGA